VISEPKPNSAQKQAFATAFLTDHRGIGEGIEMRAGFAEAGSAAGQGGEDNTVWNAAGFVSGKKLQLVVIPVSLQAKTGPLEVL
jgi:hypothetical protein